MAEVEVLANLRRDARELTARLRRWLGSAELQNVSGAYCAWRDEATGALAFEYPEITGYALTWLGSVSNPTAGEDQGGRRAADWLLRRLDSRDRSSRGGWDGGAVYTFDLGMIAAGLITFGTRVGNERYIERGRATAREIAGYVQTTSGLQAIAPDGPRSRRPGSWSTSGRPHLVKCAQALLLAGEDDAAATLVRQTIGMQRPDGRFQTQPDDETVMLHPHLYAAEGLWMLGTALGDQQALESARKATCWAWDHQLASGGLPRSAMGHGAVPEQLDVTSQAVRAAVLLGVEPPGLDSAVVRLIEVARPTTKGAALTYQPTSDQVHLNAWVTMFGAQALRLVDEGPGALTWKTLV